MPAWLTRLRLRLRALLCRSHDRELRDELQLHLDLLTDEYQAKGLSLAEARARAHREFGNATRMQEISHDLFAFRALENLLKDIVYAVREIRRGPGFTAVAVFSLAIGIGAATATFAVVDAFMLRGLSLPSPERLFAISASNTAAWSRWSYGLFRYWADATDAPFDTVAIYSLSPLEQPRVPGPDGEAARSVRVSLVSGNYFQVLGVPMATGRALGPTDDRVPGGHPLAVISDAFWTRYFGRAPDVVGRGLELNGVSYTILGVTRKGFAGEWIGQPTDVWLPLSMRSAIVQGQSPPNLQSPAKWLRVLVRLKGAMGPEQAAAAANLLHQRYLSTQPAGASIERDRGEQVALLSATRGYAPEREQHAQPLMILTAIVGLVLLVACANFTNLLLGRSESRQREFLVRLALGASRWRIVQQSLTECVCLAAVAGALGVLASRWLTTVMLKRFADATQPIDLNLSFDARVWLFAAGCLAIAVAFGFFPCVRGARLAAHGSSNLTVRHRKGDRIGRVLLVSQLALCVVLLIGTGLMVRTVGNLRSQRLGYDRNVLLVTLALNRAGYSGEAALALIQRVRTRLLSIHGIQNVSTSGAGLLDPRAYWIDSAGRLSVDGQEPVTGLRWTATEVGPGFFETIGMSLVRGRGFDEGDLCPGAHVAVINESMAMLLFGREDPVGHRLGISATSPSPLIVGVVRDARQISPRDQGTAVMYRPLRSVPREVALVVRTQGDAADATDLVQHQLQSIDRGLPIVSVRTVDSLLDNAIAEERLISTLGMWLGMMVIAVTCVGLYALLSYEVVQRRHEIGVRLALGATGASVASLVLRECSVLVGLALAAGVPLGIAAMRPLSSRLFGLQIDDPATVASVVLLLFAVTAVAAARPARAAARTDPVALLRAD